MEKIAERKTEIQTQFSDNGSMDLEDLDPRVKEMYEGVRDVMKRFRSGKVPKAFKIIPRLKNWEQVLLLTEPHNWSSGKLFLLLLPACHIILIILFSCNIRGN